MLEPSDCAPAALPLVAVVSAELELLACELTALPPVAEEVAEELLDAPDVAALPSTALEVAELLLDAVEFALLALGPVACADAVLPELAVEEQLSPLMSVLDWVPLQLAVWASAVRTRPPEHNQIATKANATRDPS